ncbi:MAG: hypothetical protein A2289_10840 [Deltaproteobacteria bacterium RIFOXYA12_FULL_58_15]|nr:MAG: hypothetical protein A2289_10840 [Deltaproteobacteria bacterium RIFOXYA12_FULL_58_15]
MRATREDVRRAAGRHIICGFDGTELTPELNEILREVNPAGLILFARNVEAPEQVNELCRELKTIRAGDPLLICVDQEGGRVARIRAPATEWPTMREVGRCNDPKLTERLGSAMATELRAMGIDLNLAPVLDVDTNPDNPVIGDRSFSREPETVAELGCALARGLEGAGVGSCGKHFPGHGDTDLDSHFALPHVGHSPDRLRNTEWIPFRRAIDSGMGAVMTAHVVVEALDPTRPATLSRPALSPLRDQLGFRGVIVSDDIEMQALADHFTSEEIAVFGVNAGIDVFLAYQQPEAILNLYRSLVVACEQEIIDHADLLDGETRLIKWRQQFCRVPGPWAKVGHLVGHHEHRRLITEIHQRAMGNV